MAEIAEAVEAAVASEEKEVAAEEMMTVAEEAEEMAVASLKVEDATVVNLAVLTPEKDAAQKEKVISFS